METSKESCLSALARAQDACGPNLSISSLQASIAELGAFSNIEDLEMALAVKAMLQKLVKLLELLEALMRERDMDIEKTVSVDGPEMIERIPAPPADLSNADVEALAALYGAKVTEKIVVKKLPPRKKQVNDPANPTNNLGGLRPFGEKGAREFTQRPLGREGVLLAGAALAAKSVSLRTLRPTAKGQLQAQQNSSAAHRLGESARPLRKGQKISGLLLPLAWAGKQVQKFNSPPQTRRGAILLPTPALPRSRAEMGHHLRLPTAMAVSFVGQSGFAKGMPTRTPNAKTGLAKIAVPASPSQIQGPRASTGVSKIPTVTACQRTLGSCHSKMSRGLSFNVQIASVPRPNVPKARASGVGAMSH